MEVNTVLQGLERTPTPQHLDHLWADYVELLCLVNVDREFSQADLLDRIHEGEDIGAVSRIEGEGSTAEAVDTRQAQVDEWFRYLESRMRLFEDFYPFSLTRDGTTLVRSAELSVRQRFYVFLLLCSRQLYLSSPDRNKLSKCFEVVSKWTVKNLLPDSAQVFLFDPDHRDGPYVGNLWARINRLAEDLNEVVRAKEEDYDPRNVGDDGLDIVAWIPMDPVPGIPILFGQCACRLNWSDKQHTSRAGKWKERISMKAPSTNMVFIPYCYRRPDGQWYKPREIIESILFDRCRIVNFIGRSVQGIMHDPAFEVVERVLEFEESVF